MSTRNSDILVHPVRLRIVLAAAGDAVTTSDLAHRLPDVPQASLYRHTAALAAAGILDVVDERQARVAVEKTYRVNDDRAHLGTESAAEMTNEEHLNAFAIFSGALIETYGRYLGQGDAAPHLDGVSIRQVGLWQSTDELHAMVNELAAVINKYAQFEPTPERRQRFLSTVLLPEPSSHRPEVGGVAQPDIIGPPGWISR